MNKIYNIEDNHLFFSFHSPACNVKLENNAVICLACGSLVKEFHQKFTNKGKFLKFEATAG